MVLTTKTYATRIDLSPDVRNRMIQLLNQLLADTSDLYRQTKQAHWNVKGPQFYQLHELFDELAAQLRGYVDMIAERTTTLGGVALGTNRISAQNSRLPEWPIEVVGSMDHVAALADRFAMVARETRAAIDTSTDAVDWDTADMLTEISRGLDKGLWFLEAHLQSDGTH